MQLRILGANGAYPTPGRPTSGYLVRHEESVVWVDVGSGTLAAALDAIELPDLDAVVISHIHVDHCVDVLPLYYYLRFNPRPPVPLFVPAGAADHFATFVRSAGALADVFSVHTVGGGGTAEVGAMALAFGDADHPVPTISVRLEAGGRVLAYSADTGPECELAGLAREAHLFLCEASYQGDDKETPHHLTASEAGRIARTAGVERLMVTHLWPAHEPARSVSEAEASFGRPVELAVPGMEVKV